MQVELDKLYSINPLTVLNSTISAVSKEENLQASHFDSKIESKKVARNENQHQATTIEL